MKIGVLLKEVPDSESIIRIAADARSIETDRLQWTINPYDEIALEEALRLKEKLGGPSATASPEACRAGEVVVITAGPARAVDSMRKALAIGADRGILIRTEGLELDPATTASVLAGAARRESFDVIFAGKTAFDDGWGQVHIGVAEMLGIPCASPVERIEFDMRSKEALCARPASAGIKETVRLRLPAVIGCEKGLNQPRYASLPGIIKARSKPIAEFEASVLGGAPEISILTERLSPPPERRMGRMIGGTPREAARELARLLREEAKVI
ncbi:MAG: electron transfer flavoprotein subunit beta/FixA family protein [Proteobacteria bacterium]|nr:electron transfer flavoprotein subunit beta/FixA family protein [Pseudomonadota bacterium]